MLTVAKVTGTAAIGYADYLQGKVTASSLGDYYLKDGERVEAPGRWVAGAGAVGADPTGRVAAEQLRALMGVRRPDTGQPLRPVGASGEAVAALDATFSAPKSVSAVWALADPALRAQVEHAHETAIDRAINYATAQVAMVRERVDRHTVIHARAREVVATSWRHTTARSVDGQPPDPQLHSHVLLHAAVRRDGRVVAIDSRRWLVHRRELGAAYRTELARELATLGFAIQRRTGRGGRYFEIEGVPAALTDRWSSRHHQVREAIESRLAAKRAELEQAIATAGAGAGAGDARSRPAQLEALVRLSPGEERLMAVTTRGAKPVLTVEGLDGHWAQTATDTGLDQADVAGLREPDRPGAAAMDPVRLAAALTEHDAILTRPQARAIALEQYAGAPIGDALTQLARMRDRGQLLELIDETFTTQTHRARERATVTAAARIAAGDVEPIPPRLVDQHAQRLDDELHERGAGLSAEQRTALALACSDSQLVIIEGQAGTGKSTVLTGVARAHEQAGQQIIVTSTAALAAQRLADELTTAGTRPTAHSTVGLRRAVDSGRVVLDPATTIIHDEAALASTRELDGLLDAVEQSGVRVILIGDPRQSQPVGAGGLWPHLEDAARRHDAHIELTRNLRARDPEDARDQARFRAGEHEAALEGYTARGRVHLHSDQVTAEDSALDAAHHDRQAGRRAVVIAQTSNDHLDELNARAQAIRRQHGQLGAESLPLPGRPYRLHPGDDIQLRATITHPEHGTLRNGTTATVTWIDPDRHIAALQLADGRQVTLDGEQLDTAQARLAYVQHPFPAQGITSDTTHLIVAEHATREGSYVALTRARHETHLHAPTSIHETEAEPLAQLAEQLSRTEPDLPSIAVPIAHEQAIRDHSDDASRPDPARPSRPVEPRQPRAGQVERAAPARNAQRHATKEWHPQDTLGPRPDAAGPGAEAWDHAAQTITAYRARHDIDVDDLRALGPAPAAGAFAERLDHRHAATTLREALHRLDRLPDASLAHEPERDLGWEP